MALSLHLYIRIIISPNDVYPPHVLPKKMPWQLWRLITSIFSSVVFLTLDFLDSIFCVFFGAVDGFLEGNHLSCCCEARPGRVANVEGDIDVDNALSETLHGRRNLFRELGCLGRGRKWKGCEWKGRRLVKENRWSDCGCLSCLSWLTNAQQRLHVVVKEPLQDSFDECQGNLTTENVIFLHGFLSSSSFWTHTVLSNLSERARGKYRLFAVDLLGFGRSPKPSDCLYTLKDHLEMIGKSVLQPFQMRSFHLVAHSMGCVIALALAAKYSNCVKTVTLIAPPYFSSSTEDASLNALTCLAGKRLWPPLSFGSAFMSWYEHLGRCVCFFICRNHRIWEWIVKLITRREVHFLLKDLTRHTHHSAWHTMHNVICGGAKLQDRYLETLNKCGVKIYVYQGAWDQVVPLECSSNIKKMAPNAHVIIVPAADHYTIVLSREKEFARDLECVWESSMA